MSNPKKRLMIAGYGGLPFGEVSQCEAGNIGFLGVPSEVSNGPRMGASLAPDAVRRMTQQLGIELPVNGRDLGNLALLGDWSDAALMQLVTQLVDNDVVPVVLGGASDVALAVLHAILDLPVVAAMPMARGDVAARQANTIWVGLNGEQTAEVWVQINQRKMGWRTARQLDEGAPSFLKALSALSSGSTCRSLIWGMRQVLSVLILLG